MADHKVHDLMPDEVSKGMAEGRYLLVDVRELNEVATEAYPGGVVVPLSTFDPKANTVHFEADAKSRRGQDLHYVVDGTLDKKTLSGTWDHETRKGDFKITKD